MIDMDASIRKLYDEKKISARAAVDKAIDKTLFKDLIESGAVNAPHHWAPGRRGRRGCRLAPSVRMVVQSFG
jgi:hypothetical protein